MLPPQELRARRHRGENSRPEREVMNKFSAAASALFTQRIQHFYLLPLSERAINLLCARVQKATAVAPQEGDTLCPSSYPLMRSLMAPSKICTSSLTATTAARPRHRRSCRTSPPQISPVRTSAPPICSTSTSISRLSKPPLDFSDTSHEHNSTGTPFF